MIQEVRKINIKSIIKKNSFIRSIAKKIKIYKEFLHDAHDFSKNYMESSKKKKNYEYSIMLLVHSLEKGMCMPELRPFGADKATELIRMLKSYMVDKEDKFEYKLGISILHSYQLFFEKHGWQNEQGYAEVCEFLKMEKTKKSVDCGCKFYENPSVDFDLEAYEKVIFSKHSVRDFQDKKLEMKDIQFALKCFIDAPTACNRQMCKLYYIDDSEIKDILNKFIIGISGFNKDHINYFIITYDLAAFDYSGERQQGMFNAGLCTMNFMNGLHANGIGSCCLQWSNKHSEDVFIRHKLGIADSERIGIVVGAGYYLESTIIPCSVRKQKDDFFKVI
jgi:nitroreductase